MINKNILKSYLSIALTSLLISNPVYANDSTSIIVFDASGSMWKQLDNGRTKIETARDVLGGYLKDRDQSIPLGVIAYGHNRKGDCSDIETIASVGIQNGQALSNALNKINPKGKTPLTDALALAVKQIPRTSEEADIILITDGLETCGKDPCALAQKIAEEGIKIRAHVVGFGLTEKEVNTLACIPKKTGGQLLRPQSGKELADALKKVETKVAISKPSEPAILSIKLDIQTVEGTSRPTHVNYSAKNIQNSEVIQLGKTVDAREVLQGLSTKLPQGEWLLMAKGPLGGGELKVDLKKGLAYKIPYKASKPSFSLKNNGPYQLGQNNTFLLNITKPLQGNSTHTVALVPTGATEWNQIIDRTYLFAKNSRGEKTGFRPYSFDSPKKAGTYQIIITPGYLNDTVAKFPVEFVDDAKLSIKSPTQVKPKEVFPYEIQGNTNGYNHLKIMKEKEVISDLWLSKTITAKGTYLTAPEKEGTYKIVFHYKNAQGEKTSSELAELIVSDKQQTTEQDNPKIKKQTNTPVKSVEKTETEMEKYYAPAKSLQGDWSLINLNLDDDRPKAILKTHIIHNEGEKTAKSNIIIIEEATLGTAIDGELFKIERFPAKNHQDTYITIAFKTSKGSYKAKLSYHPIDFDERVESWRGELLLNNQVISIVALDLDNSETDHPYQGKYSAEESSSIKKEDQANSTPIGDLQGNWRLVSDGQLLLKTQLIHNKGTNEAEGSFIAHEEKYLGSVKSEALLTAHKEKQLLSLNFNTSKGHYSAKLNENSDKYKDLSYSEAWDGTVTFPNKSTASVLFGKVNDVAEATAEKKLISHLYDLSDPKFIFTCKQKKCSYDYTTEGISLKNIPLLKDWAITEPFYYATAGSGASKNPSIEFVNTKNGLWMTLNPRMADPKMLTCVEFGKNGRLSSEERICHVNEEAKETGTGSMITLLEQVEFWREQSYPQDSETNQSDEALKSSLFSDGEAVK